MDGVRPEAAGQGLGEAEPKNLEGVSNPQWLVLKSSAAQKNREVSFQGPGEQRRNVRANANLLSILVVGGGSATSSGALQGEL